MPSLDDTAYPRLKSNPSQQALDTLYTPTAEEIALARRRTRGEVATVGFLVLLKTFQTVGYPVQIAQVPNAIIRQVVTPLKSSLSPDDMTGYDASGTRRRHLSIIRDYLKIQAFGSTAQQVMVTAMETSVQTQHDLVDLINVALEELVRARFELPGFSTLLRTAKDVRARDNERIYQRVYEALKGAAQLQINELFYVAEDQVTTDWNALKQEPGEPKLGELQRLIERLNWLKPLQVAESVLGDLSEVKRLHLAAAAQALDANQMKELPAPKRYTLAAAFLQQRYGQTLDGVFCISPRKGIFHNETSESQLV